MGPFIKGRGGAYATSDRGVPRGTASMGEGHVLGTVFGL